MRLAFVLLMAINIAVLLWGVFVRSAPPPLSSPPGGNLQLIDEGGTAPDTAATVRCLRLDPPLAAPAARKLAAALRGQGHVVALQPPVPRRYRVHAPPMDSISEAAKWLHRLRDAGLGGAALAVGGNNPNSIVVGAFDRLADAREAHRRVLNLGLQARIDPPQAPAARAELMIATTTALPAPRGSRWVTADCPPAGG